MDMSKKAGKTLVHTQDTGVTDLWGGQVSYNCCCPHRDQYVYFIYVSYHCQFCCKRSIDSNHNEQLIDSDGFKSIWSHLHAFSHGTSKLHSFLVLRSHWNFVWRLIVVVCCAGSYLLHRPCRQLLVPNHHRYLKLTKQFWKYNVWDPEQRCNCQERGWIRHHPRCWRSGLVEGRRTNSFSSHFEGTLESIMWVKWGSPSIPLGRGDLHITHPELCE